MKSRSNRTNNGVIGTNNLNNGSNGVLSNNKNTALKSYFNPDKYVRPSDWLAMPTVNIGDEKICILNAVFNTATNFVSFKIWVTTGTYTVNWGDGTTTNYTSATVAERNYDYATVGAVNPTASSEGYRMAMITITPTTPGATIWAFDFRQPRHSSTTTIKKYSSGFLEILMSAPNVTSGTAYLSYVGDDYISHGMLQQFDWIGASTAPSFSGFFYGCYQLVNVKNLPTENATNLSSVFYLCYSLRTVPKILKTSKSTLFSYMFYGCVNLQSLPFMDTSNATDVQIMCYGCYSATYVPPYNFSKTTTCYLTFYNMSNVVEFPPFNCPLVTNLEYMYGSCVGAKKIGKVTTGTALTNVVRMFYNCQALQEVEVPSNTSNVTNFTEMFNGCLSLKSINLFTTSSGTNFSLMFQGCQSLLSIPAFNTSNGTNFTSMFSSCQSLKVLPALNTTAGTNFTSFANNCVALRTFSGLTLTGAPTLTNMFAGCAALKTIPTMGVSSGAVMPDFSNLNSLQSCGITGIGQNVNFTSCQLSGTELNALYTSLATVGASGAGAKTITITGNWGAATDTPSIATNKGWTVTG